MVPFYYGTWEYTEVVLCFSIARQWWTSKQHFRGEKIKQKRRFIFPFFFFVHPGTVFSSRFFKGSPFLLGTHYLFQSYTDFIENIRNPEKYFVNLSDNFFWVFLADFLNFLSEKEAWIWAFAFKFSNFLLPYNLSLI